MKKYLRYFDLIDRFFFLIAQIAVFVMMLTISIDALSRYLFQKPIVGAYEFIENYLMVIAVFLSLSYVMKINGHIKVDILVQHLPASLVRVLNVLFMLVGAVLMVVIGYQGLLLTAEAWVNHYTSSGSIPWPTWLSVIWVPTGSFLFAVRLILEAVKVGMEMDEKDDSSLEDSVL